MTTTKPEEIIPTEWDVLYEETAALFEEAAKGETFNGVALDAQAAKSLLELLRRMRAAIKGSIPLCLTCMDSGNVHVQSGWTGCPERCREKTIVVVE